MFTEEELKNEEWRKLINYPGYSVSSLGRVRSDPHKVWNGKGWHVSKEKMLKPNTLAKGYYQVDLRVEKKRHPGLIPCGLYHTKWDIGMTSDLASSRIDYYKDILAKADKSLYKKEKVA